MASSAGNSATQVIRVVGPASMGPVPQVMTCPKVYTTDHFDVRIITMTFIIFSAVSSFGGDQHQDGQWQLYLGGLSGADVLDVGVRIESLMHRASHRRFTFFQERHVLLPGLFLVSD